MAEVNTAMYNCVQKWLKDVSSDGDDKYASGYVSSKEEVEEFLKEYRVASGVSFVMRDSGSIGDKPVSEDTAVNNSEVEGKLYWSLNTKSHPIPFIGAPFMVRHFEIRHCVFGKLYRNSASSATTANEHSYHNSIGKKTRTKIRTTKKQGCDAILRVRNITF